MLRAVAGQVSGTGDLRYNRTPPKMTRGAKMSSTRSNCSTQAPTPSLGRTNTRSARGSGQTNYTHSPRSVQPSPRSAGTPRSVQPSPRSATTPRSATPRSGSGTPGMRALMPDELVSHLLTLERERRLGEAKHQREIQELKTQELERHRDLHRAQRELDREITNTTREVRKEDAHANKISHDLETLERVKESRVPLKQKLEQRFDRELADLTKKHERTEQNYANQAAKVGELKGRLKYLQYCRKKLNQGVILDPKAVKMDGPFSSAGDIGDEDEQEQASELAKTASLRKENTELKLKIVQLKQHIAALEAELRKYRTHAAAASSSSRRASASPQAGFSQVSASSEPLLPRGTIFSQKSSIRSSLGAAKPAMNLATPTEESLEAGNGEERKINSATDEKASNASSQSHLQVATSENVDVRDEEQMRLDQIRLRSTAPPNLCRGLTPNRETASTPLVSALSRAPASPSTILPPAERIVERLRAASPPKQYQAVCPTTSGTTPVVVRKEVYVVTPSPTSTQNSNTVAQPARTSSSSPATITRKTAPARIDVSEPRRYSTEQVTKSPAESREMSLIHDRQTIAPANMIGRVTPHQTRASSAGRQTMQLVTDPAPARPPVVTHTTRVVSTTSSARPSAPVSVVHSPNAQPRVTASAPRDTAAPSGTTTYYSVGSAPSNSVDVVSRSPSTTAPQLAQQAPSRAAVHSPTPRTTENRRASASSAEDSTVLPVMMTKSEYEEWHKCRPWHTYPGLSNGTKTAPLVKQRTTAPLLMPPPSQVIAQGLEDPTPSAAPPRATLLLPRNTVAARPLASTTTYSAVVVSPRCIPQVSQVSRQASPRPSEQSLHPPSKTTVVASPRLEEKQPLQGVWKSSRVISERVASRSPVPEARRVLSERVVSSTNLPTRVLPPGSSSPAPRASGASSASISSAVSRSGCVEQPRAQPAKTAPPVLPAKKRSLLNYPFDFSICPVDGDEKKEQPRPSSPPAADSSAGEAVSVQDVANSSPSLGEQDISHLVRSVSDVTAQMVESAVRDALSRQKSSRSTTQISLAKIDEHRAGDAEFPLPTGKPSLAQVTEHPDEDGGEGAGATDAGTAAGLDDAVEADGEGTSKSVGVGGGDNKLRSLVNKVTAKALREYRVNHRVTLRGSLPQMLCRPTLRDPQSRETSASPDVFRGDSISQFSPGKRM
ncbi:unnamed protein product [Amoebophrya sp. A25]|nr:unnamed protein product [Amoebophrya sp. A25]|eukprot:GSA25T00000957001.1